MNWKVVLGLMIFLAVMMASSYTMLIPFLPLYLTTELGASEESVNLWSGAVFAITFVISAIMTPLWGRLSDRTGRKLMILRSSIMLTVVYFVGGLVQTPLQLFFMRVLQGFAAGLWPACMAMLSAYMPRDKLGLSMGLMQSANICGGIIGPLLGGVLATLVGMRNSFFVGAAGLFIITLLTLFCLKEPPREEAAEAAPQAKGAAKGENGKGEASVADSQAAAVSLFKNRSVICLLIAAGLTNMAIMQLQPVLTLYLRKLDGSTADNLMLLSGLADIVQYFLGISTFPSAVNQHI
ncbi:MAG: MFS transporter [Succinivibrio sp.]|nr:MFS transporter [Succinivibrio sp.]